MSQSAADKLLSTPVDLDPFARDLRRLDSALSRLTATGTGGMGELFKVLAISDARLGQLPGFQP